MWPDLAKFHQIGKSLNIFGDLFRVHSVFGKILNIIWEIFWLLGKFSLL